MLATTDRPRAETQFDVWNAQAEEEHGRDALDRVRRFAEDRARLGKMLFELAIALDRGREASRLAINHQCPLGADGAVPWTGELWQCGMVVRADLECLRTFEVPRDEPANEPADAPEQRADEEAPEAVTPIAAGDLVLIPEAACAYPDIPAGTYFAHYVSHEVHGRPEYGKRLLLVHFKLADGRHVGTRVTRFFNLPLDPKAPFPRRGRLHAFLTVVLGAAPSPDVPVDLKRLPGMYEITVATRVPKDPRVVGTRYSTVDAVLRRVS
jgi:hypothetical protein